MSCFRTVVISACLLLLCAFNSTAAESAPAGTSVAGASVAPAVSPATTPVAEADVSLGDDDEYQPTAEQMAKAEAYGAANNAYQVDLARDLRESGNPRDWALASQLWTFGASDPSTSTQAREQLLDNAAAAAPDDALVQWLWANSTFRPDGTCGSSGLKPERLETLLAREPDNAAVWLMALHIAVSAKNEAAIDAALVRMAAASRYDNHFAERIRAWQAVYAKHPISTDLKSAMQGFEDDDASESTTSLTTQEQDEIRIATFAFAQAIVSSVEGTQDFIKICDVSKNATGNWQRFAVCGDAARVLTKTGDMMTRLLGFAGLRSSGQQTPEDVGAERQLRWIWQQGQESVADGGRELLLFWREWFQNGNEIEALNQRLKRAGIPLVPPPLWQAQTPGSAPHSENSDDDATTAD